MTDSTDIFLKVGMFMIPFLFALSLHEYAHGWVAARLGDPTARLMGRLTLNPLSHADPIGTIVLPALSIITGAPFFGWAKPVPVNENNLKNPKFGMFLVALAGPGSNILLAIFGAIVFGLAGKYKYTFAFAGALENLSMVFMHINLMLAFFNLIPIHPLDGGKIFAIFLPDKVNQKLEEMQLFLSLALMMLFLSGFLGKVLFYPVIVTESVLISYSKQLFGGG